MSNLKKVYHNGIQVGEIASTGDDDADNDACIELFKQLGIYRQSESWESAYSEGVAFQNCAVWAYEDILKRFQIQRFHPSPFLVNTGFANEMYIKSMLLRQNVKARGHDLMSLFHQLNDTARGKILEAMPLFSENGKDTNIDRIVDIICKYREIFVNWRYLHEKERAENVIFSELIFLTRVLEYAAREIAMKKPP